MTVDYDTWRKQEAVFDNYLITLRQWAMATPKISRKDMSEIFNVLIRYRERYLASVEASTP